MPRRDFPVSLVVTLLVLSGIGLCLWHICKPRIVSRSVALDGTEMCVIQQFNWRAEPFTASFVYRKPGQQWGSFYYDHQDGDWGRAPARLDAEKHVLTIYRGGLPTVIFDWQNEVYSLYRGGKLNRTATNAGSLPTFWWPGRSVYPPYR